MTFCNILNKTFKRGQSITHLYIEGMETNLETELRIEGMETKYTKNITGKYEVVHIHGERTCSTRFLTWMTSS